MAESGVIRKGKTVDTHNTAATNGIKPAKEPLRSFARAMGRFVRSSRMNRSMGQTEFQRRTDHRPRDLTYWLRTIATQFGRVTPSIRGARKQSHDLEIPERASAASRGRGNRCTRFQ